MTTAFSPSHPAGQSRRSLGRYLAARMFWIAALPVLIAALYHSWTISQRVSLAAEQRVQEASRVGAQYVGDYLLLHRQAVIAVAGAMERTDALERGQLYDWLSATRSAYGGLLTMLVADRTGRLIALSPVLNGPDGKTLLGQSVADREYFSRPLQTGRPYISGVFLGRGFGQDPIIAVASPIHDTGGAVAGVVEGSLRLSSIEVLLSKFAGLPGRDFLLVDQEQHVVFSTMPAVFPVLADERNHPLTKALADRVGTQAFRYQSAAGSVGSSREWIVGATQMPVSEQGALWTVYVFQDRAELDREVRHFLYIMAISLTALLAGSAIFGQIVIRSTVRPIEDLARFARQVASGWNTPPPPTGRATAEIALLQENFISMLEAQRTATALLQENLDERERMNREMQLARWELAQSHAGLEVAVKERTAELQRLYEQSRLDAATRANLLKEVNHRVTNNLSSILGLLVAKEQRATGHCDDAVIATLQKLQQRIRGLLAVHRLLSASQWAPLNLTVLAERIITDAMAAAPLGVEIHTRVDPTALEVSPRLAHNLALVLNELATNALKYALAANAPLKLMVSVGEGAGKIELVFSDNGPGYPPDVLQGRAMGHGLGLITELARDSLRGEIVFGNDHGAVARISLRTEDLSRT